MESCWRMGRICQTLGQLEALFKASTIGFIGFGVSRLK